MERQRGGQDGGRTGAHDLGPDVPTRGDAGLPIEDGFDWEVLRDEPFGRLYLVVFGL